ncbi:MAG TPA: putative metal-dependent hydrolase [Bryobacteraceae bacterium]|nr:putative metal-dependent hydrolase [Bryobacteraceae bacterium]
MTPAADVRYPIGRPNFTDPFRAEDRPACLAQLAAAPANLRAAVAGLSDSQLDTPYRSGGWTVRQVVHHLADAQVNWYIRPKLAVTEDQPVTKRYAEQLWAELPDARTSPIDSSLQVFEGVTARWCRFFESLTPGEWFRKFTNPEWGTLTVEDTLRRMAWHTRHHTAHITELRKRLGW